MHLLPPLTWPIDRPPQDPARDILTPQPCLPQLVVKQVRPPALRCSGLVARVSLLL